MSVAAKKDYKDKGYAWAVLVSCVLGCAIQEGIGMAYGVMVPYIQKEVNIDIATAELIGSLHMGICTIPSPLFMPMIKQFGFRTVSLLGIFLFAANITTVIPKRIDLIK